MKRILVHISTLRYPTVPFLPAKGQVMTPHEMETLNKCVAQSIKSYLGVSAKASLGYHNLPTKRWKFDDYTFGINDPDKVIEVVHDWNELIRVKFSRAYHAILEGKCDMVVTAHRIMAHALAMDNVVEPMFGQFVVIKGNLTAITAMVDDETVADVKANPKDWAIINVHEGTND